MNRQLTTYSNTFNQESNSTKTDCKKHITIILKQNLVLIYVTHDEHVIFLRLKRNKLAFTLFSKRLSFN